MKKKTDIWKDKMFGEFLGLVYEKILIKKRLDEYEKALYNEAHKLFGELRAYLQIR